MCNNSACVATCEQMSYTDVEKIVDFLKSRVDVRPRIGFICGSGLDDLPTILKKTEVIPYQEIPKFPLSTVAGHENKLVFGYLGPTPVMCLQGRFHLYEGYPLWKVVLPVRVMKLLGVEIVILSNEAGSINPSYTIGDIMFIKDHLNFVSWGGLNPLQGRNEEKFGPRFVSTIEAYDSKILKLAKDTAKDLKMKGIQEGVYACVGGPSFDTVAEVKALKGLGADAVGMSTVHEVIAARHCGLKCFAFSLITNKCHLEYGGRKESDHEESLKVVRNKQSDMLRFLEGFFSNLAQQKL